MSTMQHMHEFIFYIDEDSLVSSFHGKSKHFNLIGLFPRMLWLPVGNFPSRCDLYIYQSLRMSRLT